MLLKLQSQNPEKRTKAHPGSTAICDMHCMQNYAAACILCNAELWSAVTCTSAHPHGLVIVVAVELSAAWQTTGRQ